MRAFTQRRATHYWTICGEYTMREMVRCIHVQGKRARNSKQWTSVHPYRIPSVCLRQVTNQIPCLFSTKTAYADEGSHRQTGLAPFGHFRGNTPEAQRRRGAASAVRVLNAQQAHAKHTVAVRMTTGRMIGISFRWNKVPSVANVFLAQRRRSLHRRCEKLDGE